MESPPKIRFLDDARWSDGAASVVFSAEIKDHTGKRRITCRAHKDVLAGQFPSSGREAPLDTFERNKTDVREAVKRIVLAALESTDQFHLIMIEANDFAY